MNKVLLLLCVIGLSLNIALSAQSREVKVSVYAFGYSAGNEKVYFLSKRGKPEEVRLSNANVLGPFKSAIDESGRLTLRKKGVGDDGGITYPVLTSIKVPAKVQEPLLVLFPVDSDQGYNGLVIDRALSKFPYGSYKLINASTMSVRGLVGDTKVQAPRNKVASFHPTFDGGLLDVHFQYKTNSKWKTFGRTRWAEERRQTLLCAYVDPRNKRMRIRALVLRPSS